jgi:hypothetical protein
MRLEYRIGNRRVSKSQWERHFNEQARTVVSDAIEGRVRAVRCPVHGTRPTRITATPSGMDLKWRIEGCCEQLIEAVNASLR